MAFDPEKITFFAKTDARGQHIPFGIKAIDRTKHMYVIGKTGMGKSTLLENMAVQDIQSGEGVAFIDPHGATAEKLLDYIPEERVDDVLYFAPFDMENPVSFNVMEDVGADKRHLVVSGLMSVFEKIWVDAWSARMAYILQNTLLALLEYPDSTLLGVNRMLSDKAYRDKVVENVTDPSVKSFWVDEFAKYTDRFAAEATPAIQNKIGQFTSNPVIRNIIGQPKSSFDLRKVMDEKKILIMNLSKGLVGEANANLLGSMLTTRIYLAAMSRADLTREQMTEKPNFYFYVDEFQSFANATFADILSEARKYKLNLTIAHQYIEQMEEEVRNAVFGNVGTIITFRVGPFDAEILETIFSPKFFATDIVNLGFAQIYLTLMIDGIGSPPFSAQTLPPIEPPHISHKDMVVAASRRQFARPRAEVEALVTKFHEPSTPPKPPAGKGGGGNVRSDRPAPRNQKNDRGGGSASGGGHQHGGDRRPKSPPQEGGGRRDESKRQAQDLNELRSVLKGISGQSGREEQSAQKERSFQQNANGNNGNSAPQNKKGEKPQKHQRQGGSTDTESGGKAELKNALKDVLKGSGTPKADSQPRSNEKQKNTRSEPAAQQSNETQPARTEEPGHGSSSPSQGNAASHKASVSSREDVSPKADAQSREDVPPKADRKDTDVSAKADASSDDVSAKELERMMRITTSDRMHFK